jgi:cytochrome c553
MGGTDMIKNHVPTFFGVVVLALLSAPNAQVAGAERIVEVPAVATPDNAAEAKNILGAKILVCSTCHGANGVPRNADVPIIWGLQENYLTKELHDFQHGDRVNEVMLWVSTQLTQEEVGSAAAYFAKKSWPARATPAAAATAPAAAAVCQVCHQQNFVGGVPAPRLAGQKYEYLVEAMRRFADGERTNNADMANIMKSMTAADREAMARYISGL